MGQEMQEKNICLFALKRSNSKGKLAKIGTSVNIQTKKTGRNRILSIEWSVKCRKSVSQKLSGVMYPFG